ncbi:MAG: TrkH family potassium uptake protein, partial [Clostridia bacterium]|nr:TrkH family potassium uptake protein [Clostridia bacterium]
MVSSIIISVFTGGKDLLALVLSDVIIAVVGFGLLMIRPTKTSFFAKEGFVVVALSWLLMSLLGALPFLFGGIFSNYIDAVFETASGLTTTGATV